MTIINFVQNVQRFISTSVTTPPVQQPGRGARVETDQKTQQAAIESFDSEEFNKNCEDFIKTHGRGTGTIDAEEFKRNYEEYKKGEKSRTQSKPIEINLNTIAGAVWGKIKEKTGF